ncbi:MAG TPA: hypothetical protein VM778_11665, partial [Gemmatimonadota bacterium]|nr:hypothetical protein [Gemmatimonadota bacterium]
MLLSAAASALLLSAALLSATPAPAFGQQTADPFPEPIEAEEGVIVVYAVEFASLLDVDGEPARPMKMVHEPASGRYFVSDQWGSLYVVGEDGGTATGYLDVDDPRWDVQVDASGRERGVQSFALH